MTTCSLPVPEKSALNLGYVRLTDSAPLIAARELGYFESFGLDVTLSQEVSWANVRDKLAAGVLDAAQMLAPLPAMTTLGISGLRVPMLSGLILSLNGNAITLSSGLVEELGSPVSGPHGPAALTNARRLAEHLSHTGRVLNLGIVHSFSTHAILLRAWLKAGGVDPEMHVRTLVVPPSQMIDSLASGVIDGYCVGEPWNSIAVQNGLGHIVAFGNQIWENAPEKVLAVTEGWHRHNTATHLRLRMALMSACTWLTESANRVLAARMLGAPVYLDLPEAQILPSLTGQMVSSPSAVPVHVDDFHVFSSGQAGLPAQDAAAFMIERCAELLGRPIPRERVAALVAQTARPDLYHEAADRLGHPAADAPSRRTPSAFALK